MLLTEMIGALGMLLSLAIVGKRNIIGFLFLLMNLLFVLIMHIVWRITSEIEYIPDLYLFSIAAYTGFTGLIALILRFVPLSAVDVSKKAKIVPELMLAVAMLTSVGMLVLTSVVFGVATNTSGEATTLPYGVFVVSTIAFTLGFGAAGAHVIRWATDVRPSALLQTCFVVFLLATLVLGSPLGGRRTLLILGMIFGTFWVFWNGAQRKRILFKATILFVTGVAAITTAANYFQTVRFNITHPNFTMLMDQEGLDMKMEAVRYLLTPQPDTLEAYALVNRSGPLHTLYLVIEAQARYNINTNGEIIIFSFLKSIPSILVEKSAADVDEIINKTYGLYSTGTYGDQMDLSGSLVLMTYSDFGSFGVFVAAAIFCIIVIIIHGAQRLAEGLWLNSLGTIGVMIELVGAAEGTIVSVLSSLRTMLIVVFICLVLYPFTGSGRRAAGPPPIRMTR
jgi:hypothetical protein